MVNQLELASMLGRRPISSTEVSLRIWGDLKIVILSGSKVSVEPVKADRDTSGIFTIANEGEKSERLWDYMSYGPFTDEKSVRLWLMNCETSKDPMVVVFRDKITEKIGGMGSFMSIKPSEGVAEIGSIWFGHTWQRSIKSTEALSLMMYHVLENKGYRRLEWKCNALNTVSRSAALRLGFRYEGTFLNHMVVKGCNRDTAWFSIIEEEWPAVYEAHIEWLAPENFDDKGNQKLSLSHLTSALW